MGSWLHFDTVALINLSDHLIAHAKLSQLVFINLHCIRILTFAGHFLLLQQIFVIEQASLLSPFFPFFLDSDPSLLELGPSIYDFLPLEVLSYILVCSHAHVWV